MKLMIATDIHGSLYYATKIIEIFHNTKSDKLLLLGDLYYHGPRNALPNEYNPLAVSQLLNLEKDNIIAVQGNCDAQVDQMISQFELQDSAMVSVDGIKVYATHGHIYNADNLPDGQYDVLVYGHYHINAIVKVGNVLAVNVGSASIPKDNHHSCCFVSDNTVSLIDIDTNQVIATSKTGE